MSCLLAVLSTLASTASAEIRRQAIEYRDGGQLLEGLLTFDDTLTEKKPGVLVVHEWWGLNEYARRRAEELAKLGYVAFALDMYGKGKVTEHPSQAAEWAGDIEANKDAWLRRAEAGLAVLRQHPRVDSKQLLAIGYCFGGATVLQLAYGGADLLGVVSFHGSLPIPSREEATRTKASLLLCHGAQDAFIAASHIQELRARLEEGGSDYQLIYYAGAKHGFTNPGANALGLDNLRYDPRADSRSWKHMQVFFEEILDEK